MVTQASLGTTEDYREWLSQRGLSGHTLNAYVGDVRGFLQDEGLIPGTLMTFQEFEKAAAGWMNRMRAKPHPVREWEWSAKTTQRKLTSLRSYGTYLGLGDILKYYAAPQAARTDPKVLTGGLDDIMLMIEAARGDDTARALVALLGLCGMRIGEALDRRPSEFNFRDRKICITRGKGSKDRVIPMSEAACDALLDAVAYAKLFNRPRVVEMGDRVARRCITRLARDAGIPGVASHMLRATFATEAYEYTKDIVAVQELLGHSSIDTTRRSYVAKNMEGMRNAVEFANRPKLGDVA